MIPVTMGTERVNWFLYAYTDPSRVEANSCFGKESLSLQVNSSVAEPVSFVKVVFSEEACSPGKVTSPERGCRQ